MDYWWEILSLRWYWRRHADASRPERGFSADRLAERSGISTNELMAANRRKELSIQETGNPQITGSARVRLYGFACRGKLVTLTVEEFSQQGPA
jgi:hypothetical protein